MKACPNCGNEIKEDAVMCEHCGTSLEEMEEEVPTAEEPSAGEETPVAEEVTTSEESTAVEEPVSEEAQPAEEVVVEEAPVVEPEKAEVKKLKINMFTVIVGAVIAIAGLVFMALQELTIGIGATTIGLITLVYGIIKKR